jgi:hypothetical protein
MDDPIAEGCRGLMEWSDPVIYDRLQAIYSHRLRDPGEARNLASLHAKIWRALISGEYETFAQLREGLVGALHNVSLNLDDFAAADAEILVELLEIIVARFQRSQRTAVGYHLALIELSRHVALPTAA